MAKKGLPEKVWRGYQGERQIPMRAYSGVVLLFNALFGLAVSAAVRGKRTPVRQSEQLLDLALTGAAVHKLSRVVTRDAVMAPFRAPFTRFEHFLGYGEVLEESRGGPIRSTIGDLISCNYCTDMWIGLGFLGLDRVAPEVSRAVKRFFAGITIADFLHVQYEKTRTQENVLTLHEERLENGKESA